MAEAKGIVDEIHKIDADISGGINFSQRDTETTLGNIEHLVQAAHILNMLSIADFGGKQGAERGEGLVEQVIAAAFQSYGGEELHPDTFEKAAMILRGITQGHPFADGNKRTGFLMATYFLERTGVPLPPNLSPDETYNLCMRISSGEIRSIGIMTEELRRLWSTVNP